jgi:hypothetical protein
MDITFALSFLFFSFFFFKPKHLIITMAITTISGGPSQKLELGQIAMYRYET